MCAAFALPDSKLESELKETLKEMETRERKLALAEEDMGRQRKDHKADLARQLSDIRDASRRMQKDFSHQVEVEQHRVDDLRRQVASLGEEKMTADKRYRRLEEEFAAFRHAQAVSPEGQMRERCSQLSSESQELRAKLDAATRAKQKYKTQWYVGSQMPLAWYPVGIFCLTQCKGPEPFRHWQR